MKKVNSIYIYAILLGGLLAFLSYSLQTKSASFYGFAENKETEINHIEDVLIEKIHVDNGQEVKKGDLLIEVKDAILPSRIDGLKLEKEVLEQSNSQKRIDIQNKITEIEMDRDLRVKELESKIKEIEKEIALNESLYEGLKTIDAKEKSYNHPNQTKLEFLRQNQTDISQRASEEIKMQRQILSMVEGPSNVKSKILDTEITHFEREQEKLFIYAPSDGLIGNITCKEGENISAFSTLMNFYKHNPTFVKGYVHEKMILEVKVGDELEVSSSLNPDHKIKGVVFGLGSRIVEIPERLRKMADFKTYGREVLIKIPPNNKFLQKEKVLLNTLSKKSGLSFGNLFTSKKPSTDKSEGVIGELKD